MAKASRNHPLRWPDSVIQSNVLLMSTVGSMAGAYLFRFVRPNFGFHLTLALTWAVLALGNIGPDADPAVPDLIAAMERGSAEVEWNASLALAMLIGRGFTARGWNMEPGDVREIGDLPAYTFVRDGERELQPCAERFLNDREIDALLKSGLVPIASRRDRAAVVAVRFQSVSDPSSPLAW